MRYRFEQLVCGHSSHCDKLLLTGESVAVADEDSSLCSSFDDDASFDRVLADDRLPPSRLLLPLPALVELVFEVELVPGVGGLGGFEATALRRPFPLRSLPALALDSDSMADRARFDALRFEPFSSGSEVGESQKRGGAQSCLVQSNSVPTYVLPRQVTLTTSTPARLDRKLNFIITLPKKSGRKSRKREKKKVKIKSDERCVCVCSQPEYDNFACPRSANQMRKPNEFINYCADLVALFRSLDPNRDGGEGKRDGDYKKRKK